MIVRDMWLTGFDAPSMHTLYIDKPMKGHNLSLTQGLRLGTLRPPLSLPYSPRKMSVRTRHRTDGATFYCTFTCWQWLPLIERTSTYDHIYNWMHIAKAKGFRIFGYVIMPNHVHLVIHAAEGSSINALLANAKRFLAYAIRNRLIQQGEFAVLETLKAAVRPSDAARGQDYRMFMTSSDIRECVDDAMVQQKLDYIHANPVKGKWMLAENYLDYPHSSAGFYERGDASSAPVENYQLAWNS